MLPLVNIPLRGPDGRLSLILSVFLCRAMFGGQMKVQIGQMDEELARYHKTNTALELQLTELKAKLKGEAEELATERLATAFLRNRLKRIFADIHSTAQHTEDPKGLTSSVRRLYRTYCTTAQELTTTAAEDVQQEHNKQREYLERTVGQLRRKVRRGAETMSQPA